VLGLFVGVLGAVGSSATAPDAAAVLARLTAVPADASRLERRVDVDREEGDEGFEMPPAVYYNRAHDIGTFLAATDRSLCRRPEEREICDGFLAMIAGRRPPLGTDVSETRIGGVGYATLYLSPVDGVQLHDVDAMMAFLGGDTQDDAPGEIVLYLYARRGSNLVQMTAPVGSCQVPSELAFIGTSGKRKSEEQLRRDELAYYRRVCAGPMVAKARAVAQDLAGVFRLAH
jgi:hypothetical protein